MNRRTFLQATGLLSVSPLLLAGKNKEQWIKMTDQQPKMGEHILLLSYEQFMSYSCFKDVKAAFFRFAVVEDYKKHPYSRPYNMFKPNFFVWELATYQIWNSSKGVSRHFLYDPKLTEEDVINIQKSKWITGRDINTIPALTSFSWWYEDNGNFENLYWIPMTKDVKNQIPELPIKIEM